MKGADCTKYLVQTAQRLKLQREFIEIGQQSGGGGWGGGGGEREKRRERRAFAGKILAIRFVFYPSLWQSQMLLQWAPGPWKQFTATK